jgi:hypothetical protein
MPMRVAISGFIGIIGLILLSYTWPSNVLSLFSYSEIICESGTRLCLAFDVTLYLNDYVFRKKEMEG